MHFKRLVLGILNTNCYILSANGKEAVVIDPAGSYAEIERALAGDAGLRMRPVAVLLTHGHLDHTNAVKRLQNDGAAVYMGFGDKPLIGDDFGLGFPDAVEKFSPDKNLADGEILNIAGLEIEVIHTPGHSAGSMCFLAGDLLFSGDTLFFGCAGRTDLPTGCRATIEKSIREKLYTLPVDTRVFPGHDRETTIGYEKKNNYDIRS